MRPIKNIHLSIPEDLLIDAQKYAAEHNTTLNVLIIELLKSRVSHCCKDVTDILDKYTDKWEIDTLNTPFQRDDIHKLLSYNYLLSPSFKLRTQHSIVDSIFG